MLIPLLIFSFLLTLAFGVRKIWQPNLESDIGDKNMELEK